MKPVIFLSALLLSAAGFTGCSPADSESNRNVGDSMVRGTLGAGQHALGRVGTIAIEQAIQRFRAEHGRNPESLEELQQRGYLPRMPDPPSGQRFAYDAASGTVRIVTK